MSELDEVESSEGGREAGLGFGGDTEAVDDGRAGQDHPGGFWGDPALARTWSTDKRRRAVVDPLVLLPHSRYNPSLTQGRHSTVCHYNGDDLNSPSYLDRSGPPSDTLSQLHPSSESRLPARQTTDRSPGRAFCSPSSYASQVSTAREWEPGVPWGGSRHEQQAGGTLPVRMFRWFCLRSSYMCSGGCCEGAPGPIDPPTARS